jgi:hypothetical protein
VVWVIDDPRSLNFVVLVERCHGGEKLVDVCDTWLPLADEDERSAAVDRLREIADKLEGR